MYDGGIEGPACRRGSCGGTRKDEAEMTAENYLLTMEGAGAKAVIILMLLYSGYGTLASGR
jgi:hypothetical protein